MIFVMLVSLYTSRMVLQLLGVVDYGIYSVVGGVVAMMSILNGAMSSSILRYYSYEIGRGNPEILRKTFCISINIYVLMSLLFLLLAESVGLWFVNTHLVIPQERISAANWVYQYTIFAMIAAMLSNPFNAIIVAHEKMSVYAYISIINVVLQLGIVFLLPIISYDRLSTYGFFILLIQLFVTTINGAYSLVKYPECKYKFYKDVSLHREIMVYSGWNIFGSMAGVVKTQGLNVLLNMFFNPVVNAARAVATQVNAAVMQMGSNFYSAVRPQVTKLYAQNNHKEMFELMFWSSRMSFFLILIISLPIVVKCRFIINLWLGIVPEYSVSFIQIIVWISAVDAMANPLMTAAHSTGKNALYQTLVGCTIMLNIPLSYLFLKCNYPPTIVFYISLVISVFCLFLRVFIVRLLIKDFPVWKYIQNVFVRSLAVVLSACVLVYAFMSVNICREETLLNFVIVSLFTLLSTIVSIASFGLTKNEKKKIVETIRTRLR